MLDAQTIQRTEDGGEVGMSRKLKWCLNFNRVGYYWAHGRNHKIRKKNHNRAMRMMKQAFKRWGAFPLPPEWMKQ